MSVYFVNKKGWGYDLTIDGKRMTGAWFKTKGAALKAEAERRLGIMAPLPTQARRIDMTFLDLVNARLDFIHEYRSEKHYEQYRYLARRWVARWKDIPCSRITEDMIRAFVSERRAVSAHTANKEIRYLRATFNYARKRLKVMDSNPAEGVDFYPRDLPRKRPYVPTPEILDRVIEAAVKDDRDYLWTIRETMARVSEINRLEWRDVNLRDRYVILYTRKKAGGHLTARNIPMTEMLFQVLSRRYKERDPQKAWVFWHRYRAKDGRIVEGPYKDRKKLMGGLCKKAGVPYFRYHAIRHAGASVMDKSRVPIGSIQRILGHENRKTTEIYLHELGDMDRHAMRIYEASLRRSHTDSHTAEVR